MVITKCDMRSISNDLDRPLKVISVSGTIIYTVLCELRLIYINSFIVVFDVEDATTLSWSSAAVSE